MTEATISKFHIIKCYYYTYYMMNNNNNLCISRFICLDNYLFIIKKFNFTTIIILKSTFHYKTSKELIKIILYRMN